MISLVSPKKGNRVHANVTAGTTATALVGANPHRKTVTLQNQGSVTVFLGKSDVATSGASRGYALFAGASFTDNGSDGEWYGIVGSGTAIVHIVEVS